MEVYAMLIDGEWVESKSIKTIDVVNPATEEVFAKIQNASADDVIRALQAAERSFPQWAALSPFQRGEYLWKASRLLEERKEKIGQLMSKEQGKPVNEAIGEVEKTVEMLQFYAEEGKRAYGKIVPNPNNNDQSLIVKQPIGVVSAISPWNYPVELTGWKAAAALAAGCTVVAKPPELTPLSPLEFWRCLKDAGVPKGVVNAITGPGHTVGRQLVNHPISQKIAFTGSGRVGLDILDQTKGMIKKISLELGGQCPMVISQNCHLDDAVQGAVRRAFRNMGQICIAINRIYVQEDIYETFLQKYKEATEKLVIANGQENPAADLGPMANREGLHKTNEHIADALAKGARMICGGKRPHGAQFAKGYFFQPTILSETNHDMLVMTEETFGPVVGVMKFKTIKEAVKLCNATPFGLAAYAYTNDLHEMNYLTMNIEAGSVAVNNVDAGIMNAPYGGWKQSGVGYEHGHEGLEEYLHKKHIRIRYQPLESSSFELTSPV